MPEPYARSVCATERLLRNAIAQKMISGWAPVDAFHIPVTVLCFDRAGRSGVSLGANGCLEGPPEPSVDVGDAQVSLGGPEDGTSVLIEPSTCTQDDVVRPSPPESKTELAPPKNT